ncbi:MAG: glutamate synthase [Acidobacteria bacterium]|nr:glutamate synthase [Acidobacteriota bacterium]
MAHLTPYPLGALVRRMFHELDRSASIFDLPARRFFLGDQDCELSVSFHGRRASSPFGPAAGPHSQLAQNIVLSWLAGGRIIELKTIQVVDRLNIPRPCIDMRTVGYNVEWSQELRLDESLEEYVKAAMLVEMLVASGRLAVAPGFDRMVYDMSVGYDLAGITSERVQRFIRGMTDASGTIDRLRREIPEEFKAFRDLDYRTRLSDSVTLSTFHGCPADEIEHIVGFLLKEGGLHCTVKLNPTLLGRDEVRALLNDALGYRHAHVPDEAFDRDTTWGQMTALVDRLGDLARALALGFGVKFTNTLIVENDGSFLPASEPMLYLSGPPLHVLAMHVVRRFRRQFGSRHPISFSGGVDRINFPDAVALGLVPVTVCTDLLKTGGYGRARNYYHELLQRMRGVGAVTIDEFILRAYGAGIEILCTLGLARSDVDVAQGVWQNGGRFDAIADRDVHRAWVAKTALANTERYVESLETNARYARAQNDRPPRKLGSHLRLFDCLTCDKCIPVCPNDATFAFAIPPCVIPVVRAWKAGGSWEWRLEGMLTIDRAHQIAIFADLCNDCGNCDVFCPEDGGPYVAKARFFGSRHTWRRSPLDGFCLERRGRREIVLGRFAGAEYRVEVEELSARYSGSGFEVIFDSGDPERTLDGHAEADVDLTYYRIMNLLRAAVLDESHPNYVNSLQGEAEWSI